MLYTFFSPLTLFCYLNLNVIHIVSENWSFDACCVRVRAFSNTFFCYHIGIQTDLSCYELLLKELCFSLLLLRLPIQLCSDAINCLSHLHFQCANLMKKICSDFFCESSERASFFLVFIGRINYFIALLTKSFTRLLFIALKHFVSFSADYTMLPPLCTWV